MIFSFKKIIQENLPSLAWLPNIVSPVNKGFEDIQRILNRGLTVKDNLSGAILSVTVDGTYPVYVAWTLPAKPVAAWLTYCRELTGEHTTFTTAPFLDWEWDGSRIKINGVTAISPTPSAKFTVEFIAITG